MNRDTNDVPAILLGNDDWLPNTIVQADDLLCAVLFYVNGHRTQCFVIVYIK